MIPPVSLFSLFPKSERIQHIVLAVLGENDGFIKCWFGRREKYLPGVAALWKSACSLLENAEYKCALIIHQHPKHCTVSVYVETYVELKVHLAERHL